MLAQGVVLTQIYSVVYVCIFTQFYGVVYVCIFTHLKVQAVHGTVLV